MTGLDIAYHHWEVTATAELRQELLIQPALVVLDRQEQVGAPVFGDELKNADEVCSASAWINTPSSSSVLSRALSGRASQSHAIADELVNILVLVSDLGKHLVPQQPEEQLQIQRCGSH